MLIMGFEKYLDALGIKIPTHTVRLSETEKQEINTLINQCPSFKDTAPAIVGFCSLCYYSYLTALTYAACAPLFIGITDPLFQIVLAAALALEKIENETNDPAFFLDLEPIARIAAHPNKKAIYQALLAHSYYPEAMRGNVDYFMQLTDPKSDPLRVFMDKHPPSIPRAQLPFAIVDMAAHPDFDRHTAEIVAKLKACDHPTIWGRVYYKLCPAASSVKTDNYAATLKNPKFDSAFKLYVLRKLLDKAVHPDVLPHCTTWMAEMIWKVADVPVITHAILSNRGGTAQERWDNFHKIINAYNQCIIAQKNLNEALSLEKPKPIEKDKKVMSFVKSKPIEIDKKVTSFEKSKPIEINDNDDGNNIDDDDDDMERAAEVKRRKIK